MVATAVAGDKIMFRNPTYGTEWYPYFDDFGGIGLTDDASDSRIVVISMLVYPDDFPYYV